MSIETPNGGVEPSDPLRMRASDGDRERVATVLRDAFADGRLDLGEHEERLALVYAATTYADLLPAMADLPVPANILQLPTSDGTLSPSHSGGVVVEPGRGGALSSAVGIFGGFEHRGAWTVPASLRVVAIFGVGELDLTHAILTSRETVFTVTAAFGGVSIVVPPGISVRNEALGIFGGVAVASGDAGTGAPVLVIRGLAMFGGIDVKRAGQSDEIEGRRPG